jgi:hypothetical protein
MFGSSFPLSCLYDDSCLIYVLCASLRIVVSNTYCVVFLFCFLRLVYDMLPVSLDCPLLMALSVISSVYLQQSLEGDLITSVRQWPSHYSSHFAYHKFPTHTHSKNFFIETKFDLKNIKYMYMYHIFQNVSSNNSRISIRMHFHNIIIENDHITIRFLFKVDYCFTIISYDGLLWYLTF